MASVPLDRERVQQLAEPMYRIVRDHLIQHPMNRRKVEECLNALAIVTSTVLAGSGFDPNAMAFFDLALAQAIRMHPKEPQKETMANG